MDRRELDGRSRIGTVKAAINMYGERILEGSPSLKKPMIDLPESSSRVRELHKKRRDADRYKESRRAAETVKASAESELSDAKRTVMDLASQIEDSSSRLKTKMRDVEMLKKPRKHEDKAVRSADGNKYAEVMSQLENVKQEMSKLKLDVASALEEKVRADRESEASSSRVRSYSSSVETLRKEIEGVNEEQVLVELARLEAMKEFSEIEAQRDKEAREFSSAMEEKRKKMEDISKDIDHSEELESKLTMTLSDINVLKNELKLVKEMERKVQRNDSLRHDGGSTVRAQELEGSPSLSSITEELEAAKKELALIREEGFKFMASMDIIRNEVKHVTQENIRLKRTEEKADLTLQNLNSKLLRAKSKLEAATAAEEKAKSIVSNLSLSLEQLKTEAELAKKEKALIAEEIANIKTEIEKTESEIDLIEEKLASAMQELESVKSSEALALERLQTLIVSVIGARASASQHRSSITISKFEYEYLTGRAVGAEEIADKKVAAAQAWIEALKANEREILMKIEATQREIKEKRVEEEREVYRAKRSLSSKRAVEEELRHREQKREKSREAENMQLALPKRSAKLNGNSTPSRHGKARIFVSPAVGTTPRSTSFVIRKRRSVMPNLAKLFGGKRRIEKVQ